MENYSNDIESSSDSSNSEDDDSSMPVAATPSEAYDMRERISDWCVNEGDVPFQHTMV